MNTLDIIKEQIDEAIKSESSLIGLNSILTHIERAEFLLNNAMSLEDEHYYTDIIYRTNHAFEGILKEAFNILSDEVSSNKTPYEIENYLLENNFLNERVVELLKNYREKWRNPSTHDYTLFFDYSEAFLAIITISAFVHILMNQISEKIYYNKEKELLKMSNNLINDYSKLSFIDKVQKILISFAKRDLIKENSPDDKFNAIRKFEREVIGGLKAYFENIDNKIILDVEPIIDTGNRRLRPDLIVKFKKEKAIIEIKLLSRDRMFKINKHLYEDQLISYLLHSNIHNGILYMLPHEMRQDDNYVVEEKEMQIGDSKITIITIRLQLDNKSL